MLFFSCQFLLSFGFFCLPPPSAVISPRRPQSLPTRFDHQYVLFDLLVLILPAPSTFPRTPFLFSDSPCFFTSLRRSSPSVACYQAVSLFFKVSLKALHFSAFLTPPDEMSPYPQHSVNYPPPLCSPYSDGLFGCRTGCTSFCFFFALLTLPIIFFLR